MSLNRGLCGALALGLLSGAHLHAQQPADSGAYAVTTLDSTVIRGLPLVRNAEVTSFMPRTMFPNGYHARVRGLFGGPDIRVDGVPITNLTYGGSTMELSLPLLQTVQLQALGTGAHYGRAAAFDYVTAPAANEWHGSVGVGTDENLTGSIGSFRAEAHAGGALAGLKLNAAVHAQSAQSTEFNNRGDAPIYTLAGVDTTVSYTVNGTEFSATLPAFGQVDQHSLPGTSWNSVTAGARLDFLSTSTTSAFAGAHYSRLQHGHFSAVHAFNPMWRYASRSDALLLMLGVDHAINQNATLNLRLGRLRDEAITGALSLDGVADLAGRGTGPQFGAFDFLIDNDDFPVNAQLIAAHEHNGQGQTPFPVDRSDLSTSTVYRFNPYGAFNFSTRGIASEPYMYDRETRLYGSLAGSYRWRNHRLNAGAELSTIETSGVHVGYRSTLTAEVWQEKPKEYALFVEDLFRINRLTVQAGIRFDAFGNGSTYSEVPGYRAPDATFFTPELSTSISPRLAALVPVGSGEIRIAAGRAAQIPQLYTLYNSLYTDIFRFGNSSLQTIFARPLELIERTYAGAEVMYPLADRFELRAGGFWNESDNEVAIRMMSFENPTNPGSNVSLRVPGQEGSSSATSFDLGLRYDLNAASHLQLGVSRESMNRTNNAPGVIQLSSGEATRTSIFGMARIAGIPAMRGLAATIAVRALSPEDLQVFFDGGVFEVDRSWIKRIDSRLSYDVRFAGMRGSLWVNAFRLAGTDYESFVDPLSRESAIRQARDQVGGGAARTTISLTSVVNAGPGVRNEADLFALRRAEARFGNGDLNFTEDEQIRAFGAAADFQALNWGAFTQQRRIEVGIEVGF